MTVKVENLTKVYGDQKAIDNISFEVVKGDIVGFLGPNGAGKSTTMKIISCYTLPTSGIAYVNDYNIFETSIQQRKQIGYLPENNPLYETMYIKEFLLFIARIQGLTKGNNKRIDELISLTGLESEKKKKISELSKGYRQRVGLAQALIHDPEVLLLDEPTSGLDPNQVIDIRNLIKEIGKTKTIILSSHIMQEVQAMCNRVIIINKGKIIADDKTDVLLSKVSTKNTFKVKFKNIVKEAEIQDISGVEQIHSNGEYWEIASKDDDINEQLFHFAVKSKNIILEMTRKTENLEKVFQKLTISTSKN
ncbi:MAG: ATP-binding cassette domain-containing protein [Bacteroidota bacterium]|nr:ATP-binding cassette domain-containing protein [Bacteroidota bacterium]